jgi:hypothetical protein
MKSVIALFFALVPMLSFADVTIVCSNADTSTQFSSSLSIGGTRPVGAPAPLAVVTLVHNGAEVANSHATLTNAYMIDAPASAGPVQTTVFSATLNFQTDQGPQQDFVICSEKNILYP